MSWEHCFCWTRLWFTSWVRWIVGDFITMILRTTHKLKLINGLFGKIFHLIFSELRNLRKPVVTGATVTLSLPYLLQLPLHFSPSLLKKFSQGPYMLPPVVLVHSVLTPLQWGSSPQNATKTVPINTHDCHIIKFSAYFFRQLKLTLSIILFSQKDCLHLFSRIP